VTNGSKALVNKTVTEAPRTDSALRISEIFYSLQGEARAAGIPTVFVRLTGCPLRCVYCDTEYAFRGGQWMSPRAVLDEIARHQVPHVCVTGGEPLAQKHCQPFLKQLCDEHYDVSLETCGAMDISRVDSRVNIVLDMKTPDSGEAERNRYENLALLKPQDQVKFVISSKRDFDWSRELMDEYDLASRCENLFSPVHAKLEPSQLADWILKERLPVRLQLQLHKLLWGDQRGR